MQVEYILPSPERLEELGIDEDTYWLICEMNNELENMRIEMRAMGEEAFKIKYPETTNGNPEGTA